MRFFPLPRVARTVLFGGGLAVLAGLAGCSTTAERERAAALSCPQAAVLAQAATLTRLAPGADAGSDKAATKASMAQPILECHYDVGEGQVSVDVTLPVRVTGQGGTFPYFVAILDLTGTVLSKQTFSASIGSNGYSELSVQNRRITLGKDKHPYDYEVLTGFQLTPAELAHNESQRNYHP